MDIAKWLGELGLGRYAAAFAENRIDGGKLLRLTEERLEKLGVDLVGDRMDILDGIEKLKAAASRAFVDIDAMPTVLAVPLREYVEETHPVLKLWHACDVVELALRLVVAVGLADLRERGGPPAPLLKELGPRIEEPTLGKWKGMALAVAKGLSGPGTVVPEAVELVNEVLVPLLDGSDKTRTPETSFSALRNQLAHGGGVTRGVGARLLDVWAPRFEEAAARSAWLAELAFVVRTDEGTLGVLRGPTPTPTPFTPEDPALRESLETALGCGEGIALVRGAKALRLWPLAAYGLPRSPDPDTPPSRDAVAQMYVRRGEVRLQFTPIGSKEVCQSEGDEAALDAFLKLLRFDEAEKEAEAKAFSVRGFERDIRKDAGRLVGRSEELERIRKALEETSEGVLWLTGPAGIGKSFLVARVAARLLDDATNDTLVLPYRFKAGDDRCSRSSFLTFAIERLERELSADEDEAEAKKRKQKKPVDQFKDLLQGLEGRRALFILDGLDEIAERDAKFAEDVPLRMALPGVTWFCAGRPERGLPEAFTPDRCKHVFPPDEYPDGVPPMGEGDIRTMLLEKIGPLRKKLLRGDREGAGRVMNPFIQRVAEYARGFPLYVKYVIGDVLSNRYRALDAGERLPPSLDRYHEELLRRCSVGSLQQVLTPLAATLAVAREPLTVEALAYILLARNLVSEEDARGGLVGRGLSAIASMLRRAATPDGETGYALFHHSLRQHMEESAATKGALDTARKALCDLAVEAAKADPAVRTYLLRHGVMHLVEAERWDDVEKVLTDFDYVYAKNELTGPQALITDYEDALALSRFPQGKTADALGMLADTIRLSAHVIADDPTQCAGQVLGRVGDFEEPEIKRVAGTAQEWRGAPRLRSNRPVFWSLLRTLSGHSDSVFAVAVTPDGRAVSASEDKTLKVWNLKTGECEQTLEGHADAVLEVAVMSDRRVASGARDGALKVWDLETGKCERTLEGHSDWIIGIVVMPDGRLVSSSKDETLKVWNLATGKCERTLRGHSAAVCRAAITPDGRVVSASMDKTLKVWNLETGECELTLEGHSDIVLSVAVMPDGRVASGSVDETLKVWNPDTGECERTLEGHSGMVNGIAVMPDGRVVSASEDETLKVWNLATGECEHTLEGHSDGVDGVAAMLDGCVVSGSDDNTLKIWDLHTGEIARTTEGNAACIEKESRGAPWLRPLTSTLTPPGGPLIRTLSGHSGTVIAVAVTPDGRAVSGSDDKMLKVWDLATGECERTLEGHESNVEGVDITCDGRAVSGSLDKTLKVWDLETGECERTLEGHSGWVFAVAVTPDGRAVSGSDDHTLRVWDLESGECERTLEGHSARVTAVAVTPDGRAVSGSEDNTLKVWNLATGECERTLERQSDDVNAVAVTPDGRVVSGSDDKMLKVWDLATGECERTLSGHSRSVIAVAVMPDGRAVSGARDCRLRVWNLETGECERALEWYCGVNAVAPTPDGRVVSGSADETLKVWNLETGECERTLEGHGSSVEGVDITRDGRVVSGLFDGTLKVCNLETGRCQRTLEGHSHWVTGVALTPDGRAVSASSDEELKVWDLETGECERTLKGHRSTPSAVAVTPDGRAVSASFDRTLKVWNLETGGCERTLKGHLASVKAVAVTPDGRVVSGSSDKTLKVWDLETGEAVVTFTADAGIRCCAVAPDGRTIVAGDAAGHVHFLRLEGV